MSRLTRDVTAEPVLRGQIIRPNGDREMLIFPVQLTTSRIWQPYPADPYSAISDDYLFIYHFLLAYHEEVFCARWSWTAFFGG